MSLAYTNIINKYSQWPYVLVKISQMLEAALSRFFWSAQQVLKVSCNDKDSLYVTVYKQYGFANTQDKDMTVYFPKKMVNATHLPMDTDTSWYILYRVYTFLHVVLAINPKRFCYADCVSVCHTFIKQRITSVWSLLKQIWWTKYQKHS